MIFLFICETIHIIVYTRSSEEYRNFWGEKSCLRRFQDGSILEACHWGGSHPTHHISGEVASFILKRHLTAASHISIIGGRQIDPYLSSFLPNNNVDTILSNSSSTSSLNPSSNSSLNASLDLSLDPSLKKRKRRESKDLLSSSSSIVDNTKLDCLRVITAANELSKHLCSDSSHSVLPLRFDSLQLMSPMGRYTQEASSDLFPSEDSTVRNLFHSG